MNLRSSKGYIIDVSVIIYAFNSVNTIAAAIESVLAQSRKPKEIIVVDDGSADATSEVAKMYDGVILLRQKNMGVAAARNNGMMMAASEWVAFLDADDTWHKDKLQKQYAFHKKHGDILISCTDEAVMRSGRPASVPQTFPKSHEKLYERSLSHCIIAASSVMLHKKVLKDVGDFDERFEMYSDYDLWLRVMKRYETGLISEPLITRLERDEERCSVARERFYLRALESLHADYPEDKKIVEAMIEKYTFLLSDMSEHYDNEALFHYEQRLNELLQIP